ncbi:MAG TPA: Hsp70 family protein [Candidatus Hydrogenedens sp.]|nr:Hsp70 family protein [Candidatus Hydrogenedens sp.]
MRYTIDYGIDLGTTNSAISRIENGVPVIIKSDTLKDTMPSCVHFTNRGIIFVGDRAYNELKREYVNTLKTFEDNQTNTFVTFKRTMGSDHKYFCPNTGRYYTSEELSAEVLKKLKSFVTGENVKSIVITHPVTFIGPKIEATKRAAELAGFEYIELLQEPVAASIAYGIQKDCTNGYWLVYDFGGGTFDVSLVKSEDGILSVIDNAGRDPLGGKDIDLAIVDNIIFPYLQSRYSMRSIINNPHKKEQLRKALRIYAEEAKIQLSFQDEYPLLTNLGDLPFRDDNNVEPEIDMVIKQKDIKEIVSPIFQESINITIELLKRNHLETSSIDALLLVGGPTYSPVLRDMVANQITDKIPISIDPMTVVAKGAALYASTRSIPEKIRSIESDLNTDSIKIELRYESCTTESTECLYFKVLDSSKKYYVEITRSDNSWSSGRKLVSDKPELFDVSLLENRPNNFTIYMYDELENKIACEPNGFCILHGIGGVDRMQTLPYHIGISVYFPIEEKELFIPVKGLEKGKSIGNGITGVVENLKTRQNIRPGNKNDIIRIPIYQGDFNAEGTNPDLNYKIIDVIISGDNLPKLLPEGSPLNITIKVDPSQILNFEAEFPTIEHSEELKIEIKQIQTPSPEELIGKVKKVEETIQVENDEHIKIECDNLKRQIEQSKDDVDGKIKIDNEIRRLLLETEKKRKKIEWIKVKDELKEVFYKLEELIREVKANNDDRKLNMTKIETVVSEFRNNIEIIIREENLREAKRLIIEINKCILSILHEIEGDRLLIELISHLDKNFDAFRWTDPKEARRLINQALNEVRRNNPNNIRAILKEIVQLMHKDGGDLPELELFRHL